MKLFTGILILSLSGSISKYYWEKPTLIRFGAEWDSIDIAFYSDHLRAQYRGKPLQLMPKFWWEKGDRYELELDHTKAVLVAEQLPNGEWLVDKDGSYIKYTPEEAL